MQNLRHNIWHTSWHFYLARFIPLPVDLLEVRLELFVEPLPVVFVAEQRAPPADVGVTDAYEVLLRFDVFIAQLVPFLPTYFREKSKKGSIGGGSLLSGESDQFICHAGPLRLAFQKAMFPG